MVPNHYWTACWVTALPVDPPGPTALTAQRTNYNRLKKRDTERFDRARYKIKELIEQASAEEIELAYVNEAGWSATAQPLSLDEKVKSMQRRGLDIIVSFFTVIEKTGDCQAVAIHVRTPVLRLFDDIDERDSKSLVVILDNFFVHAADNRNRIRGCW
jgi:hypothetical protein